MPRTPWQEFLSSEPAPHAAAGLAWLPELAPVRFSGSDARAFLQGYLTCDTTALERARLTPTALCSLKGRVVLNGWCALLDDGPGAENVLLVLHASLVDRLAAFLRPYLAFSRTALSDLGDELALLASLDLPADPGALPIDARRALYPCAEAEARSLWAAHPHVAAAAWFSALTADGVALVSEPTSEAFLPQMLDLHTLGAVDFAKGCYLGQEVVARAQHRGQVKRHLTRLRWHGSRPPAGAEIRDGNGRVHGVVVQSAADEAGGGPALAVLRDDAPKALEGDTGLTRAL